MSAGEAFSVARLDTSVFSSLLFGRLALVSVVAVSETATGSDVLDSREAFASFGTKIGVFSSAWLVSVVAGPVLIALIFSCVPRLVSAADTEGAVKARRIKLAPIRTEPVPFFRERIL